MASLVLAPLILFLGCKVDGAFFGGASSHAFHDRDRVTRLDQSSQSSAENVPILSARTPNPVWPGGISEDDVDILVEDIMKDPSINAPTIPDFMEKEIYRSTTIMTLNAVYQAIGGMHGQEILGHEFLLERRSSAATAAERLRKEQLLRMKTDVDEELLEEMADRLLRNSAINQKWVPDVAERAIYISCLKIIFRILNMLFASLRVTVCGHDMTINLERSINRRQMIEKAQQAVSSETPIDTDLLRILAREYVLTDNGNKKVSQWNVLAASQQEFLIGLHGVLYGLILGIFDDLLANTELVLMSDRITFDIVTRSPEAEKKAEAVEVGKTEGVLMEVKQKKKVPNGSERTKKRRKVIPFVLGVAVGVAGTTLRIPFFG